MNTNGESKLFEEITNDVEEQFVNVPVILIGSYAEQIRNFFKKDYEIYISSDIDCNTFIDNNDNHISKTQIAKIKNDAVVICIDVINKDYDFDKLIDNLCQISNQVYFSPIYCSNVDNDTKKHNLYLIQKAFSRNNFIKDLCTYLKHVSKKSYFYKKCNNDLLQNYIVERNITIPYTILQCDDERNDGKVWVLINNERRYLCSFAAFNDFWKADCIETEMKKISWNKLNSYRIGPPISQIINNEDEISAFHHARALFTNNFIYGKGIEFGPGDMPMPLPPYAEVEYADAFDRNEHCNSMMKGQFPTITYKTSYEEMKGIDDNSQNFIVSSHVIEHTINPIKALENTYNKLTKGGVCFMAIPHYKFTFDSKRQPTNIKHLISDYLKYDVSRDFEHYLDFDLNVNNSRTPLDEYCEIKNMFINNPDKFNLHYHVFCEENFQEMVDWFEENVAKWSYCKVIKKMKFEVSNEFYFLAIK